MPKRDAGEGRSMCGVDQMPSLAALNLHACLGIITYPTCSAPRIQFASAMV